MFRRHLNTYMSLVGLLCFLLASACSSDVEQSDVSTDNGVSDDVELVDAGGDEDIALSQDVAVAEDLATPEDTAVSEDLSTPEDVAIVEDVAVSGDVAAPDDTTEPVDVSVLPPPGCGGFAGIACEAGEFCEMPENSCMISDMMGTCVSVPGICTTELAEVCGCDGKTYANDCVRQKAQVQKKHDGACDEGPPLPDFCGGIAGFPCPEGMICDQAAGMCLGADIGGSCVPDPEACTDQYDPVCGCDGVTYSNDCQRLMAGATLDHVGECGAPPNKECSQNGECLEGEFCGKVPTDCDGVGQCIPIPQMCIMNVMPVCGCDEETYSNACVAHSNGVNVLHDGSCDEPTLPPGGPCGGFIGDTCAADEFCDLIPGTCQLPGSPGNCVPVPEICTAQYDPVCGCNGMTYSNDCKRKADGAQLDHVGECEAPAN